jgi:hypothetical protein
MATPTVSGIIVDRLDEHCPQWEIALHRAKPWRAKARDGSIYWQRYARAPPKRSQITILK